jgi:hypothetical protein
MRKECACVCALGSVITEKNKIKNKIENQCGKSVRACARVWAWLQNTWEWGCRMSMRAYLVLCLASVWLWELIGPMPCFSMTMKLMSIELTWPYALLQYEYESLLGLMPCFSMTMKLISMRAYLVLCLASVWLWSLWVWSLWVWSLVGPKPCVNSTDVCRSGRCSVCEIIQHARGAGGHALRWGGWGTCSVSIWTELSPSFAGKLTRDVTATITCARGLKLLSRP